MPALRTMQNVEWQFMLSLPSYLVLGLDDVLLLVVGHGEEGQRLGHRLHLATAELLLVARAAARLPLPHGDTLLHVLDDSEMKCL